MSDYHFPDPVDVDQPFHFAVLAPWLEVVFNGSVRKDCAAVSASGGWVEIHVRDLDREIFVRKRIYGSVELRLSEEAPEDVKAWLRLPRGDAARVDLDLQLSPPYASASDGGQS